MVALMRLLVYKNGMVNRTGKRKTETTKMRLWQLTSYILQQKLHYSLRIMSVFTMAKGVRMEKQTDVTTSYEWTHTEQHDKLSPTNSVLSDMLDTQEDGKRTYPLGLPCC